MASLTQRMMGAAKLDVHTYEEVEADTSATGQAMAVVVLHSIAAGIGTGLQTGILGLALGAVGALIGWFIWALVVYLIGAKILPEAQTHSDIGELLRTIGFSASPGVLLILWAVPAVGPLIGLAVGIWMLVAMVIAVRQALDYRSTWRAVGVCFLGFIVYGFINGILRSVTGIGAS